MYTTFLCAPVSVVLIGSRTLMKLTNIRLLLLKLAISCARF